MAKPPAETFVRTKQDRFTSKFGNRIWRIDFTGLEDRKNYYTFVDPTMRNYVNWQHIIENPDSGFLISNLTLKVCAPDLISADSKPVIEHQGNPDSINDAVREYWQETADFHATNMQNLHRLVKKPRKR